MKDTALYFLYRVAFRVIPHNQFAKAIYNRFKNAGEVVDLESWELLEIPFDEKTVLEENDPIRIERHKDYRFLYLYLKAFRKFPALFPCKWYKVRKTCLSIVSMFISRRHFPCEKVLHCTEQRGFTGAITTLKQGAFRY